MPVAGARQAPEEQRVSLAGSAHHEERRRSLGRGQLGTHHGVGSKYLGAYLGDFTYRFDRRHEPDGLFFRAVSACAQFSGAPVPIG